MLPVMGFIRARAYPENIENNTERDSYDSVMGRPLHLGSVSEDGSEILMDPKERLASFDLQNHLCSD